MARVSRKRRVAADNGDCGRGTRVYKAAIYIRLSVEDIRKKISDSIGTQRAMLMNFLQTQLDMKLFDVYEDVNYTGTNFNRPAFARLMEDIQAGRVDCVIVKDLSRFGRNFREAGHYLERVFPFLQVRFISVSENYDSLTASVDESSLSVPLKNLTNEFIARDISRKVQSGKKVKQQRGEFCGSFAPYGYIKVGTGFVVDEEAAAVVRMIFEWILDGMSDHSIALRLNEQKLTSPSRHRFEKGITKAKKYEDSRFWYKSVIKRISENPAYTGVMASGKFKSNFLQGGGVTAKNSDEWIITENAHPTIIDSETFESVQQIRRSRREAHTDGTQRVLRDNIFKGLVFCGDCKAHMARQTRRAKFAYVCHVYQGVDKTACTPKTFREADLQEALFAYISREISLAADVNGIIEHLHKRDSYKLNRNTLDRQIEGLQGKLTQNRRFRGSLREDLKDDVLTEQDYAAMKADYDAERDGLQRELDALVLEKSRQETTLSPENVWLKEFRRFENERQLSAQMLTALVERIDIYDNSRIEVTLRYRDELEALNDYLDKQRQDEEARAV